MYVQVGLVDGSIHQSENMPESEWQSELDAVDGDIFSGDWSGKRIKTIDELSQFFYDMAKIDARNDTQTISLQVAGGITRQFNAIHVMWVQVVRDDQH